MKNEVGLLLVIVCCLAAFIACSGCANHGCSLINLATEQVTATDQVLKEAAIEQIDSGLENIITTEISWGGYTHSFLSERVEIEGRWVILYNVCGQIDAEGSDIDWTTPMSANLMIIYPPIGADCCVCIDEECALFPREVE